jgi:hypothetical protein
MKGRSKYGARKVTYDGIAFASLKEGARYLVLKALQQAGRITNLRLQVPYPCKVGDVLICKYIADFTYVEDGKEITEDAKGVRTPIYRLKKKLIKALYGIDIKEV